MKRFILVMSMLFSLGAQAENFGLLGYDPWPFVLNPIPWTEMDGVWVDERQPLTSVFCVQTLKTRKVQLKQGQVAIREIDRKSGGLILIGVGAQKESQLFGTLLSAYGKHPFALVAPKPTQQPLPPIKGNKVQGLDRLNLRIYVPVNKEYVYSDTMLRRLADSEEKIFSQYCE